MPVSPGGRGARYAAAFGFFHEFEEIPARIALDAAEHLIARGERPVAIRCVRRYLPGLDSSQSIGDPALDSPIYEAAVVIDGQRVRIVKWEPESESASSEDGA